LANIRAKENFVLNYYAETTERVLQELHTNASSGLSDDQIPVLQKKYGPNKLKDKKSDLQVEKR
jgi:magnesium-transporting ATPase (P-type)